ncbi:hypothetical protein D3C73_1488140 [compost metagenome]
MLDGYGIQIRINVHVRNDGSSSPRELRFRNAICPSHPVNGYVLMDVPVLSHAEVSGGDLICRAREPVIHAFDCSDRNMIHDYKGNMPLPAA